MHKLYNVAGASLIGAAGSLAAIAAVALTRWVTNLIKEGRS